MAVINVPTKIWTAGIHTVGPTTRLAGHKLVSFKVAANPTTDWQSGTPGRTVDLLVQTSNDAGVTWRDRAQGVLDTPNMGKAGAFPTLLEVDVSGDPVGTLYQGVVTFSANMSTGWAISIA